MSIIKFLVAHSGGARHLVALAVFNVAICLPIHVLAIRSSRADAGHLPDSAEVKRANDAATRRALRTPTF